MLVAGRRTRYKIASSYDHLLIHLYKLVDGPVQPFSCQGALSGFLTHHLGDLICDPIEVLSHSETSTWRVLSQDA